MNKELNEKLDEIINYIKESDSYKKYILSKNNLENNPYLMEEINNIKKYQKMIVKNPNLKKDLNLKINICLDNLNSNKVYIEYTMYLEEVNNMLNIFENKINKYFEDVFN